MRDSQHTGLRRCLPAGNDLALTGRLEAAFGACRDFHARSGIAGTPGAGGRVQDVPPVFMQMPIPVVESVQMPPQSAGRWTMAEMERRGQDSRTYHAWVRRGRTCWNAWSGSGTAGRRPMPGPGATSLGTGNFRVLQCDTDCRMCGLMPVVDEMPRGGPDRTPEERRTIDEESDRFLKRVNRRFREAGIDSYVY